MAKKKLSSTDIIWQTITLSKTKVFIVSSDILRSVYSLWEKDTKGNCSHVISAPTPAGFYEHIGW